MENVIEYRVRTSLRYLITRYERNETGGACATVCEASNWDQAIRVGELLAKADDGAKFMRDCEGESEHVFTKAVTGIPYPDGHFELKPEL